MMEMSVNDAAEHFGISKEAIHNRIRRGSLEVKVTDGVKMVVVEADALSASSKQTSQRVKNTASPQQDGRYYKFLEEQNAKLQARLEVLESETRSLRDQKEQMLIEERQKIELIYKEKDEQLKNILASLSAQFMLSTSSTQQNEHLETVDVELEEEPTHKDEPAQLKSSDANIVSLKKFIKSLGLSEKKEKELKKRFKSRVGKDRRVITLGEKIYLDTLRYDYSDLI